MKFIPITLHIIADYLSGLFLLACPQLFKINPQSGARSFATAAGVAVLLMSMLTRYKGGFINAIPFAWHLRLDLLFGVAMVIAAFVFNGPETWAFAGLALLAFIFGLFTKESKVAGVR